MNLINEKHIAFFQACQKTGKFTGFLDHRATGVLYVHTHGICDDVGQRRLAEAGRSTEQNVFEHVPPFPGCFHHQLQAFAHFYLTVELAEGRRP